MESQPSRLECLPNELFICIFGHFDARDLFRAFYNLTCRFNTLLHSLRHLSLMLLKNDADEIDQYRDLTPNIYTVTLDYAVTIDLNRFANVRRLILLSPTSSQLKQLVDNALPCLQHLSIGYEHFLFCDHIPAVCEKIFSGAFPHLRSCSLFEPRILEMIPHMTQSTQLSALRVDHIDLITYKVLLSLCPSLYVLQFSIFNDHEEACPIAPHHNLKRLIIRFQSRTKTFSVAAMEQYLSCVPNLEQLTVYEINFDVNIKKYLAYNWLASVIDEHLPILRRLKYHLYIYGMKHCDEEVLNQMRMRFATVQKARYQSRLVLD